jgi:hypothetical protein
MSSEHEGEIEVSDERIGVFADALGECMNDFQREHHEGKVTLRTASAEMLTVLVEALAYEIARIECRNCRKQFADGALDNVKRALCDAVRDPAVEGSDSHVH